MYIVAENSTKIRKNDDARLFTVQISIISQSCSCGIFPTRALHASLMYSGILPTLPDDHIFKKIYGFNFDSSGLPETDLLRFALVGLAIFDLYCECSFTFCRPALVWQILPGRMCFHREIPILKMHRLIRSKCYPVVVSMIYFSSTIVLMMLRSNKYNSMHPIKIKMYERTEKRSILKILIIADKYTRWTKENWETLLSYIA